ncbi:hypothetical protein RB195_017798 [Necator americanus]|uniref:Uncharacterized protein n=1 Tax=Necator americanus TaxID=51031 RepID=A0ABR1C9Y7_NECAM
MDIIGDEYDKVVGRLHDCTTEAESFKITTGHLSSESPQLIRQCGAAMAAGKTTNSRTSSQLSSNLLTAVCSSTSSSRE